MLPILGGDIRLPIAVVSRMADPDSADFADDFAKVFTQSQWQPVRIHNWTQLDKGVFFATLEGTSLPKPVEAILAAALDAAGIEHKTMAVAANDAARIPPAFQPNVLYLLVGAKP